MLKKLLEIIRQYLVCDHKFDHDNQIRVIRCRKCKKDYRVYEYTDIYSKEWLKRK